MFQRIWIFALILLLPLIVHAKDFNAAQKLRICIVEGRGSYKRGHQNCPILEANTNIECVIGVDRLDCVRRISKGTAHFGVFSSEDLVAARWAGVEVLITSELRFHPTPFEYEIVAVVDNEAGINSAQDLKGSKFCHPGHDLQERWTEVLGNYFESTLVPKLCETDISLAESKIKASAKFFGPTCKAGPWVPDPVEDRILKTRYDSLCKLCDRPIECGVGDRYWGRRGPLYCLTSGSGEVAWSRLDDVKLHFGFSGLNAEADPQGYSFLCPDGHLQPLNTKYPCVWVAKPWPAIAASRSVAETVQNTLARIIHRENEWETALLMLLESYHVNITSLDNIIPIDDYLDQAVGFQSAYSFPSCNPPRSIIYCTTSLIEHAKCSWLQEAASVYGIDPNLQCIRTESLDRCLEDMKHKVADVVLVDQDNVLRANRDYNLEPLLYEQSIEFRSRYVVVSVVKTNANIHSFQDLRGKKACFPNFEGAAYLSALETYFNMTSNKPSCYSPFTLNNYFSSDSCIWNSRGLCDDKYRGDEGALKCLADGYDVAFINMEVYNDFKNKKLKTSWMLRTDPNDFRSLCHHKSFNKQMPGSCYFAWAPKGQIMVHNQTSAMRKNEIYNSIKSMDRLFGKHYAAHIIPFTMFGPFDNKNNVMFQDSTDALKNLLDLKKDKAPRLLDSMHSLATLEYCRINSSTNLHSQHTVLLNIVALITLSTYIRYFYI